MSGAADPLEEAVALRRRGEPAALCTVVRTGGSVPAREAMRMLVRGDGSTAGTVGGGRFEEEARRAALLCMEDERCRTLSFELRDDDEAEPGLVCGGVLEVFVESLTVPTVVVLGAGHLGRAVARLAGPAGFRVVVADDRPSHADPARFPGAAEVLSGPWPSIFRRLPGGPRAFAVVVTRTCAMDEACLAWACRAGVRYAGMIGSTRKVRRSRERLEADGVPAAALERVHAPVGLDLGARTHEEIAVAVVAEMIAVRRLGASPRSAGLARIEERERGKAAAPSPAAPAAGAPAAAPVAPRPSPAGPRLRRGRPRGKVGKA